MVVIESKNVIFQSLVDMAVNGCYKCKFLVMGVNGSYESNWLLFKPFGALKVNCCC
jgi:hypothetical protein